MLLSSQWTKTNSKHTLEGNCAHAACVSSGKLPSLHQHKNASISKHEHGMILIQSCWDCKFAACCGKKNLDMSVKNVNMMSVNMTTASKHEHSCKLDSIVLFDKGDELLWFATETCAILDVFTFGFWQRPGCSTQHHSKQTCQNMRHDWTLDAHRHQKGARGFHDTKGQWQKDNDQISRGAIVACFNKNNFFLKKPDQGFH